MADVNMGGKAKMKLSQNSKERQKNQVHDTICQMTYADKQEMIRILIERGVIDKLKPKLMLISRMWLWIKLIVVRK